MLNQLARIFVSLSLAFISSCTYPSQPTVVTQLEGSILGGTGTVVKVLDGDSFRTQIGGKIYNARLACIDAMEYNAPLGAESTKALKAILPENSIVLIEVVDVDRYERLIVKASKANNTFVNKEMLSTGHAIVYPKYLNNCDGQQELLRESERTARVQKVGFWGLPESEQINPWDWRKQNKKK